MNAARLQFSQKIAVIMGLVLASLVVLPKAVAADLSSAALQAEQVASRAKEQALQRQIDVRAEEEAGLLRAYARTMAACPGISKARCLVTAAPTLERIAELNKAKASAKLELSAQREVTKQLGVRLESARLAEAAPQSSAFSDPAEQADARPAPVQQETAQAAPSAQAAKTTAPDKDPQRQLANFESVK